MTTRVLYVYLKILCISPEQKYIDVKYNFIIDHVLKGYIKFYFVSIDFQLAYIFIKHLLEERFCALRQSLGIIAKSF